MHVAHALPGGQPRIICVLRLFKTHMNRPCEQTMVSTLTLHFRKAESRNSVMFEVYKYLAGGLLTLAIPIVAFIVYLVISVIQSVQKKHVCVFASFMQMLLIERPLHMGLFMQSCGSNNTHKGSITVQKQKLGSIWMGLLASFSVIG